MSSARPPPHPVIDRLLSHVRRPSAESTSSESSNGKDSEPNGGIVVSIGFAFVQTVVFIYDFISYPIYYLVEKPWTKTELSTKQRSRVVEVTSNSILFKAPFKTNKYLNIFRSANIQTMDKCFQFAVNRHKNSRMLGYRQTLDEEEELQPNGKYFHKLIMGEYKWLSYQDVDKVSCNFGKGLRSLGLKPHMSIAIFAETKVEWMISAISCFKQNFPIVTLYANLGEEAVSFGLNQTEVEFVITSHDLLPKFKNVLLKTENVKNVIFFEDQIKSTDITGYRDGVKILNFRDVCEMGSSVVYGMENMSPPRMLDPAIIMFTSGSTGTPKGVVLPHEALIATIEAFHFVISDPKPDDIYLGYLPLAHILELLAEFTMLLQGIPIGYSSPNTMIDKSTKIKRGEKGDCSVLKPTLMCAVPLVIDRIYKGIQENIKIKGVFFTKLMNFFYEYKSHFLQRGMSTPILDQLIFRKMRALVGGRIRLLLSGGAPLSPKTHDYVRNALSLPLIQGYGLTETCACASIMDCNDLSTGGAGTPLQGVQIRLIDWEEGNYRVTDKPRPRGEIVVGGRNVALGYFKMEKESGEYFSTDGDGLRWFRTGDIGEMCDDGTLAIIDRKKDLVKLQFGEYVSLGKVEAVLKPLPVIDNICVYGDSAQSFCVALVVPDEVRLQKIAAKIFSKKEEATGDDLSHLPPHSALCKDKRVIQQVLRDICSHGKSSGLERFELPAAITLCSEPWTPESELVTSAFKLKRINIFARFENDFKRMYSNGNN